MAPFLHDKDQTGESGLCPNPSPNGTPWVWRNPGSANLVWADLLLLYRVAFSRPCGTRSDNRNTSQDWHPGLFSIAPAGLPKTPIQHLLKRSGIHRPCGADSGEPKRYTPTMKTAWCARFPFGSVKSPRRNRHEISRPLENELGSTLSTAQPAVPIHLRSRVAWAHWALDCPLIG